MMHDYWGYGGGMDFWGVLFMFLILALIVVGVVYVVRSIGHADGRATDKDNAVAILKARYAKGEIDQEEYTTKLKDLT